MKYIETMMGIQHKVLSVIATVLALSLLFAFLGVYDSDKMPFLQRMLFWGSTISTGTVMGALVIPWVFNSRFRQQSSALKLIILSSIASLPVVLVLAAYSGGLTGAWPLYNWPLQYFLSFTIIILLNTFGFIALKTAGWIPDTSNTLAQTISPTQRFLERLPIKYHAATLYAVSSEDHYIRVHTNVGEELILLRLTDALKELAAVDGMQTHRSWWIARNGVADTESKNGKYQLVLKTGEKAPISRSFLQAAREANYV